MIPNLLQKVAAVADRETEEQVRDEICRRLLKSQMHAACRMQWRKLWESGSRTTFLEVKNND